MIKNNIYKVRTDLNDWRDFLYRPVGTPLKEIVDLREWASAIEDQGHLGSCTGNAVVGIFELLLKKQATDKFLDLSRLFVYYNARLLENTTETDEGASIRDAIKGVQKYGVCTERIWPYDIKLFNLVPSAISYTDAKTRNIKNYARLLGIANILDALNNERPVLFSMLVYSGFEDITLDQPILAMPFPAESALGGHAICLVGYDLPNQLILARNSFGSEWGVNGYCWIPFDYIISETIDAWIFDITLT